MVLFSPSEFVISLFLGNTMSDEYAISIIKKATEFLSDHKQVFARLGEGIACYIAECSSEMEAETTAAIMEGLLTQPWRMFWCASCSQPYDMVAPNGRFTFGHELTCTSVITEGNGCNCSRGEWSVCENCGQKRPPKIER